MLVTRRNLIGAAGSFAASAAIGQIAGPRLQLRLLETSDLHMFALDWDYFKAKPDSTIGLNRVATLISEAREQSMNCLLFDNGDIIQGNPLGDYVAAPQWSRERVHPMFAAMNELDYDAATLGNHEFNYGLPFLDWALTCAKFPFVCANAQHSGGANYLPPFIVLVRSFQDESGVSHNLRVGVTGFVPPQIMNWDKRHLEGRFETQGIVETAQRIIPVLRKQCDILVALSHAGITPGPYKPMEENASCQLALIPGIDAIMTGHSHRVFPGPDYREGGGIDPVLGRLNGVPAVMPGFWGSHLGIIDLTLVQSEGKWTVADSRSEARPIYRRDGATVTALVTPDATVTAAVAKVHDEVRVWVDQPVGNLATPVHSYFVFAGYDPACVLVNAAQTEYAQRMLRGTAHEGIPILSAAAPFKAGYTPDGYIDLKAGPLALREAADLYIYPNTLTAIRIQGSNLQLWLEHSARIFNQITPGKAGTQPLIDRRVPSYNFDVISGLTYEIDLKSAARTNRDGQVVDQNARRIINLAFMGKPVAPDAPFILVTNNYRADGGGGFPIAGAEVALRAPDSNREIVIDYCRRNVPDVFSKSFPWKFAQLGQLTQVAFDSGAAGASRISDVAGLSHHGPAEAGYDRFILMLP